VRDVLEVQRPAHLLVEVRERDVPEQRRIHFVRRVCGGAQMLAELEADRDGTRVFAVNSRKLDIRVH
jgi:hypothetical protein